ncbi:hypothetical protein D3C83_175420 [compost metagenome]
MKMAARVPSASRASQTLMPENMLQAAPVLPTWTRLKKPGMISMCPGGPKVLNGISANTHDFDA